MVEVINCVVKFPYCLRRKSPHVHILDMGVVVGIHFQFGAVCAFCRANLGIPAYAVISGYSQGNLAENSLRTHFRSRFCCPRNAKNDVFACTGLLSAHEFTAELNH